MNRWNGRKLKLQGDFSYEGLAAAEELDGVGASEGRGQLDVAFYIYKGREYDSAILIQQLDGGAEGVGAGRQRMAVEIEDGHRDGGAGQVAISITGIKYWRECD